MIKTFKEFVNERLNLDDILGDYSTRNKFKDFHRVKINDNGEDYTGAKGKILKTGAAQELTKFDKFGTFTDMVNSGEVKPNKDSVLVKLNSGLEVVYVYGYDGFLVYR